MRLFPRWLASILGCALLLLGGCSSAYYGAMEKIGYAKRDLLVSRVEKARDAQDEAKGEFQDALTQFLALSQVEPGEIKTVYDRLSSALKDCEARAAEVHERIEAVEDVSQALFKEWAGEAAMINDPADRRESERLLRETRVRSETLIRTMQTAAARMDPILTKFRDKVLLLKANLNAQAVAGLSGTARSLEADVGRLISDMETSIRDAEAFLATLRGT
jgi:outer membrane murein-binding lipoprotein Lpp